MERLHTQARAPEAGTGRPAIATWRARGAERGFTLIELTLVTILVSIFAAMAIPQVTLQLRDRRTHEMAQRVAIIYQQARVRAMGQGGAMMVRYTLGSKGQGSFETLEALAGTADTQNCKLLPATSCVATRWDDASVEQSRSIELIDVGMQPGLDLSASHAGVFATLTPDDPAASGDAMDVCFTPLGRAFVRYGATAPWAPLAGVPQVNVFRGTAKNVPMGLLRRVLVLPTGIARLQL